MIKLILSDMDGTLLDDRGNIPAGFDEVIGELKRRNILFAPASGRQYYQLIEQFARYRHDFMFLAENGTYTAYQEQELFCSPLDGNTAAEMLARAERIANTHVVVCGKHGAYYKSGEQSFLAEVSRYYARRRQVADWSEVNDDVLKISVCDLSAAGAERHCYRYFADMAGWLQVTVSSRVWLDIMNLGVNKGRAAEVIQRRFNILPSETMAFGDYLNDLEMLKVADYSFAVANAHETIKKAARFAARSNRDSGVLTAIREFVLDK